MLTVKARGQFVATMRFVHVLLMETLAAWVPTSPEMEVKLLFGEHIWDVAQHADALGKRTFELRLPLQHSTPPVGAYVDFLNEMSRTTLTTQRLAAAYDVMLPAITARYRTYLTQTDTLSDAPTVRILERYLADTTRMVDSACALRNELTYLQVTDAGWTDRLRRREASIEPVVVAAAAPVAAGA